MSNKETVVEADRLFASLPPVWPRQLLQGIALRNRQSGKRLVVLDDDPTGTQSVHGIHLLGEWSKQALGDELARSAAFFVLTNSRSLPVGQACALAREIGRNLEDASTRTGLDYAVISHSDSTLRGHFPAEVDALIGATGTQPDGVILVPYFEAGGRFTVNDVHYVRQGTDLVPAAQTEFARDRAFSFRHSSLPEYVEEKTGGRTAAADVVSVGIDQLRKGGPQAVRETLMPLEGNRVVVVNAADARDLEVFVSGLLDAEESGKQFVYRTAADFVRIRAGLEVKPLLDAPQLSAPTATGGLMVVASHIEKSSRQLERALALPGIASIEIPVPALLDSARRSAAVAAVIERIAAHLDAGVDTLAYTSRKLEAGQDSADSLGIARLVSRCVCDIVRSLPARPRFLIAKGGITSNDIAIKALGVKRALILGQLQPGVPVWELGAETRFPGMRYVVYPGNVGPDSGLADALLAFSATA